MVKSKRKRRRYKAAVLISAMLITTFFPAMAGEQCEPDAVAELQLVIQRQEEWSEVEVVEIEVPELTPEEIEEEMYYDSLELLAICVEVEAGNQPLDGRRMVVDVILNRVDDQDFPDTIEGVITQPYHFSSYWDGNMDSITEISELTYTAVQMELEERGWPQLFYFTEGDYSKYGTPWKKVGDHYFSTK